MYKIQEFTPEHNKSKSLNLEKYFDRKKILRSCFVTNDLEISFQYCIKHEDHKCQSTPKPTIIFIHSLNQDSNFWLCSLYHFCDFANVYAIDLPNSGGSSDTTLANLSLAVLTQIIYDFVIHLCLKRVYIVGHGIGGQIALNFAATYPDYVVKVALSSTSPFYFPGGESWPFPMSIELQLLLTQFTTPGLTCAELKTLAAEISKLVDPIIIRCDNFNELVFQYVKNVQQITLYFQLWPSIDVRSILSQITAPVLITDGTLDPYVPLGASLYLRNQIVDSALVEYYGQGSDNPFFIPEVFNEDVQNFFFNRRPNCYGCKKCPFKTCDCSRDCKCGCNEGQICKCEH